MGCVCIWSSLALPTLSPFLEDWGKGRQRQTISGQYVYVTDTTNQCVSVFTTDGAYVTSFGQLGNKEGDFSGPHYLYIDKDQFVYVSDFSNNRIQCF